MDSELDGNAVAQYIIISGYRFKCKLNELIF